MKQRQFDELVTSVQQAGKIRRKEAKPCRVHVFSPPDIKAVRLQLGQTQVEFARTIGVSATTLRNWEHGRGSPEGSARTLLEVAANYPSLVAAALRA